MLIVGAAVGCGLGSFVVKDEEVKRSLQVGAATLWGCNILETLLGSSFGYLSNAKTTEQAQQTLHRMKKMPPEIRQTIFNFHYEITEQPAKKEAPKAANEAAKPPDPIDEEILAQKILARVKANNQLDEYLQVLSSQHALKVKIIN